MKTLTLIFAFLFLVLPNVVSASPYSVPDAWPDKPYQVCAPDPETGLRAVLFEPEYGEAPWGDIQPSSVNYIRKNGMVVEEVVNYGEIPRYTYLLEQQITYFSPQNLWVNSQGELVSSARDIETIGGQQTLPRLRQVYSGVNEIAQGKIRDNNEKIIHVLKKGLRCHIFSERGVTPYTNIYEVLHGHSNGLECNPEGGHKISSRLNYVARHGRYVATRPDGGLTHFTDNHGQYEVHNGNSGALIERLDELSEVCEWVHVEDRLVPLTIEALTQP